MGRISRLPITTAERLRPRHRPCSRTARSSGSYAKRSRLLKDGAIIASNTSTLPISSLAKSSRIRQVHRIHFFSPVEKMMLVEVIVGKNTGDLALAPRWITCA